MREPANQRWSYLGGVHIATVGLASDRESPHRLTDRERNGLAGAAATVSNQTCMTLIRRTAFGRRPRLLASLSIAAGAVGLLALPATAQSAPAGTITRFADVALPGHADTSLLLPGGDVLVSTNRGARGSAGPSTLFRYSAAGMLKRTYTVSGQDLAGDHGTMGLALDRQGRVYVADYAPPRVLRIDLRTGTQQTYATVPDLVGAADNGVGDSAPWPDGLAFLASGRLLVTDLAQGTVFAVAPGGGAATVWLQGPELRSTFGANNVVVTPKGDVLLDVTASTVPATAGRGVLYRIPLTAAGLPGKPSQVYATAPGEGPDGFALAVSGRVYLATLVTNRLVVIGPEGTEQASFGGLGSALDSPSSVTFVGTNVLVTNLTYFTAERAHDQVLRVATTDRGVPPLRPTVR